MSKSIKRKLMALVVVGAMAIPMVSFADTTEVISEKDKVVISEQNNVVNDYIRHSGEISEVMNDEGNISILVKSSNEDKYGDTFHISADVSLWNRASQELVEAKELKEGMDVEVFYHKNTPTTMSIPAQRTPAIVVVQAKEAHEGVFLGEFDKELLSIDNELQLNIGEDTVIVSEKGEALKEENIAGNVALVFFDILMPSLPAQTSPSKVIVLAENAAPVSAVEEVEEVEEAGQDVEEDKTEVEEVKEMISLRDTATELGYKVQWNNEDKTAEITKLNQTIVIKLDSVDYTLNKSLGKFSKAPELRNNTLYVSASVLDFME